MSDTELESMFQAMKQHFDENGQVFKKTKVGQLLRQGEIDVVGVDLQRGIHAMDIAFHERGLIYDSGSDGTRDRILKKLLERYPAFLDGSDIRNLLDSDYCRNKLNLRIQNLSLIRRKKDGRYVSGHSRYWKKLYAGEFHVCSQWWKDNHRVNPRSLCRFTRDLIRRGSDRPGIPALREHLNELRGYVADTAMTEE